MTRRSPASPVPTQLALDERRGSSIALVDAHVRVGRTTVLAGVSLTVGAGEVVAITGPSGSGKTTLVRLVLGLVAPSSGSVEIDGEVVSRPGEIVRPPEERGVAAVFQDLALWPHLTVHGNLAFVLASRGVARRDREARIAASLAQVALGDRAARYPGELSGGERQRVAIARAIVADPRILVLDEPLSNLDIALQRELIALVRDVVAARYTTALYVTHNPREAAALAHRVAILEGGRIVQVGTVEELAAAPVNAFVRAFAEEATGGGRPFA